MQGRAGNRGRDPQLETAQEVEAILPDSFLLFGHASSTGQLDPEAAFRLVVHPLRQELAGSRIFVVEDRDGRLVRAPFDRDHRLLLAPQGRQSGAPCRRQ